MLVESNATDDEEEDEEEEEEHVLRSVLVGWHAALSLTGQPWLLLVSRMDVAAYCSPMGGESSSSESDSPAVFDIDLGAFELVDSGLSAETLLSHEDPVIYHRDMPVHSVHHDTVQVGLCLPHAMSPPQTEAALENLMNAPESMLSSIVPPTMVEVPFLPFSCNSG